MAYWWQKGVSLERTDGSSTAGKGFEPAVTEPLLDPVQQRILICVLAVMLLAVSLIGLWLCRHLGKARERLYAQRRTEAEDVLVLPDRRTKHDQPTKRTRL